MLLIEYARPGVYVRQCNTRRSEYMSMQEEVDEIKHIIEDDHVERTEVYLGGDTIPHLITETVNMRLDELFKLLESVLNRVSEEELLMLDEVLAPCLESNVIYTKQDYSEYEMVETFKIDKEFLFDTLDDLVAAKTKEERINDLKEDIILYITKEK